MYADTWLKEAIPHKNNRIQKCVRYATNVTAAARLATSGEGGRCPADIFDRSNVVKCDDFVFKTNEHRLIREVGIFYFLSSSFSFYWINLNLFELKLKTSN